jgi:shikimate dehydrogenase
MAVIVFLGVTTGSSLVHQVMPLWDSVLSSRRSLRGIDMDLDADDSGYLEVLGEIASDESIAGAVVTAHKIRLFQACRGRFAHLDPLAIACEEINAITKSDGDLRGWARDPISVGRVVDRIWPDTHGQVVCLGAGGTALALAHHLSQTRAAVRLICADLSRAAVERLVRQARCPVSGHVGQGPWDDLVGSAPPGSLIVNATGMGKDRPGSPITSRAWFPKRAVVWDLNYRGELQFLAQGRQQEDEFELCVHDGWQLFCHGWAAALTPVLDLPDEPDLGDRFAEAARSLEPSR